MRKTAIILCALIAVAVYAQETEYSYVVVPKGSDPNTMFGQRIPVEINSTPAFSANMAGVDQVPAANTRTKLNHTNELFDIGGWYDATNARWTVQEDGKYLISLRFNSAGAGNAGGASIYVDGVMVSEEYARDGYNFSVANFYGGELVCLLDLTANQYVEAYQWYNTGGGGFDGDTTNAWFSGFKIPDTVSEGSTVTPTNVVGTYSNMFHVNKGGTDQSAPTLATWTLLTFTNEVLDSASAWNTGTSAFTVPSDGDYQFTINISHEVPATWSRAHSALYVNGTNMFQATANIYAGEEIDQSALLVTPPISLSSGDSITAYTKQDAPSSTAIIQGETERTYFAGWKVGN